MFGGISHAIHVSWPYNTFTVKPGYIKHDIESIFATTRVRSKRIGYYKAESNRNMKYIRYNQEIVILDVRGNVV